MIFKYLDINFNEISNDKRIDSFESISYYMPAKDPSSEDKNGK
ncbi:hypothetical protein [Acidianus brierleyi]|nr:hypothetical protein [Acidianus brierleyi]